MIGITDPEEYITYCIDDEPQLCGVCGAYWDCGCGVLPAREPAEDWLPTILTDPARQAGIDAALNALFEPYAAKVGLPAERFGWAARTESRG